LNVLTGEDRDEEEKGRKEEATLKRECKRSGV